MIPGHAAEFETAFALAAFPERVHREDVNYSEVQLNLKSPRDADQDRAYYNDSLLATAEKGEVLIRIAVDWAVERLRRLTSQT